MILAIKEGNGNIVVANGVTERFIDSTKSDMALESNIPFWQAEGRKNVYLAYSVTGPSADVLRYRDIFCKAGRNIDGHVLVSDVVPYIRDLLGERGLLDDDGEMDGTLHIYIKDKLYIIDPFFAVKEAFEMATSGYCSNMLLCGLERSKATTSRERILDSVVNMDAMRTNNSFPVVIHDTKTGAREVWYDENDAREKIEAWKLAEEKKHKRQKNLKK